MSALLRVIRRVVETVPRYRGRKTMLVAALGYGGIRAAPTVEGRSTDQSSRSSSEGWFVPRLRRGQRVI